MVDQSIATNSQTPLDVELAGVAGGKLAETDLPGGSVAYTRMETPLGPLLVAVSREGVCRATFSADIGLFEEDLYQSGYRDVQHDTIAPQSACAAVNAYFAGDHHPPRVSMDLSRLRPFDQAVLRATCTVPWGHTASYGDIAILAGYPLAYRAAGSVLSRCPISLLIPCHRIIKSNGTLGGFGSSSSDAGFAVKRFLLRLEGIDLPQ